MRTARWYAAGALLALVSLLLFACGGGGGHGGGGGGSPQDLAVTLNPNLDGNGGSVKATTIASADLLDGAGNVRVTANLVGPNLALFSMAGLSANTDYFVRINGDANDLVPARVVQINQSTIEEVGTKLLHAVEQVNALLPVTNRDFDFRTFAAGQGSPAVVKYSDGTPAPPTRYGYVVTDLHTSPQALEERALGTGAVLVPAYHPTSATHPGAGNLAFADWVTGPNRHGKAYNGNDAACDSGSCHNSLDTHPLPVSQFGSITPSNGFCFRCHYGKSATAPIDSTQ